MARIHVEGNKIKCMVRRTNFIDCHCILPECCQHRAKIIRPAQIVLVIRARNHLHPRSKIFKHLHDLHLFLLMLFQISVTVKNISEIMIKISKSLNFFKFIYFDTDSQILDNFEGIVPSYTYYHHSELFQSQIFIASFLTQCFSFNYILYLINCLVALVLITKTHNCNQGNISVTESNSFYPRLP